jgi:hypothetical protein
MKRQAIQAATLATAVAALVAQGYSPRHANATAAGITVAGNSCSGKNGCGAKPKDPNAPKLAKAEDPNKKAPKLAKAQDPNKKAPKLAKAEDPNKKAPKLAKAEDPNKKAPKFA